MELKPEMLDKSYSSDKAIDCVLDGFESPRKSSPSVKRSKRFSTLSLSVKKSKFKPKKRTFFLEDKFEILELLGSGAYGSVKSGIDKATDKKVAIKTCKKSNSREMLRSEYNILRRLNEDTIIKVIDLIEDDVWDESHMIMENFDSMTIHDYIKEYGLYSFEDSKYIIKQVLSAIDNLHKTGISHCDIKPENILVNSEKQVKLIDFNISRSKCENEISPDDDDSSDTSTFSTNLSSPLYAAPEIRKACAYSERIDIWGAGIVLFTLLLGSIRSHNLNKILNHEERWTAINKIVEESEGLDENTREFLSKLLAIEAQNRPTAREALGDKWFQQ